MANLSNINNKFLVTTGGNILIGQTNDVGFKLSVAGTVAIGADRSTYIDASEDSSATSHIFTTNAAVGDFSQLAGNLVIQARVHPSVYRDIIFAGGLNTAGPLMTILGEGRVGIGTTNPTNGKLVIDSTANQIAIETGTAGDGRLNIGHFSNGTFIGTYGDDGGAADLIRFGTHSGDERMRITSAGNVGIGTNSPNSKLHVESTSATGANFILESTHSGGIPLLDLKGAASAQVRYKDELNVIQGRIDFGDSGTFNFIDVPNNSSTLYLKTGGKVGIGTTSPTEHLTISGGAANTNPGTVEAPYIGEELAFKIENSAWTSTNGLIRMIQPTGAYVNNATMTFSTLQGSLTEKMRITNAGDVGIGTTSPAGIFHVDGGGASIYSIFSKSATKWLYLHTGGTNPAISWDSAGDMRFGTSTSNVGGGFSEKMRILSSGGITFNGDTAAANALDDYEEGTFQTNVNSTNVTNYSYSGDNGRYTKIGRQVIVTFVISSITAGTGLKYFVISNLPFTQHTSSHNEQGYCSNYPRGERRSGIIINNSSSEPNTWYVSYNNNSAQSNNSLRGTIIYTTTQ